MSAVSPLPEGVGYFLDTRGDARALRVRWHREADVVVLSTWRGHECVASFRLAIEEVPHLVEALQGRGDGGESGEPGQTRQDTSGRARTR